MDPTTIMLLSSILGGNVLGNTLFRDNGAENQLRMLGKFTDPKMLAGNANQLYALLLNSPAFADSLRSLAAGANSARSGINSNLAQRGLLGSGIGALTQGSAAGFEGFGKSQIHAQTFQQALGLASELMRMRIGGAQGFGPQRNVGADVFGASLDAIGKWLAMPRGQGMALPSKSLDSLAGNGMPDVFSYLKPR